MTDYSKISALDRSKFFRHKSDYALLKTYLESGRLEHGQELSPVNALVVGVGNLEEPLSILAAGAEFARKLRAQGSDVRLSDLLKLDFVELRPKEEITPKYSLGIGYGSEKNSMGGLFLTEEQKRTMQRHPLKPSFVDEYSGGFELKNGEYHFSEEVIKQAQEAMQKGMFSTRIQDFINTNTSPYPVIFFNNVLTHLGSEAEQVAYDLTTKTLKDEGIIFMHHSGDLGDSKGISGTRRMIKNNPRFAHLKEIGPAAYIKRE